MRAARRQGYRILAGTDPLPARGEESVMGSYASVFDCGFDAAHANLSLQAALRDANVELHAVGKRCGITEFVRRMTSAD